MYVAWRNSQVQQELRAVRDLVEASVSLHELEDDVMPALAALEEDSSRLKKQVQQLARTMTPRGGGRLPARAERAASAEILGDAGGDSNATVERAAVLRSSIGESDVGAFLSGAALPDFSLLMSMNSLLAGSHQQPGIAGIPMPTESALSQADEVRQRVYEAGWERGSTGFTRLYKAEGGAERSGCVEGPGQITADEAGDGAAGQPRGGLLRLALPALVERRVEVTHGEALFVVVGFAMAYEVKRFHGYLPRPCLPRGDSL